MSSTSPTLAIEENAQSILTTPATAFVHADDHDRERAHAQTLTADCNRGGGGNGELHR